MLRCAADDDLAVSTCCQGGKRPRCDFADFGGVGVLVSRKRREPSCKRLVPCATSSCKQRSVSGVPAATICSARGAAFGAEIDDPIGRLDDLEVVFHDEDRIARVDEIVQHAQQQFFDIGEVQPGGRLVQQIERFGPSSVFLTSSLASLIRCASPPERVGDGWPSFI